MKKRKRQICLIIFAAIAVFILSDLTYSKYGLKTTHYEITTSKVTSPTRIVQLTDLHNSEFGGENRRLAEQVEDQEPDLILMTGDMLNSFDKSTDVALNLIEDLSAAAPVYYSYGNHEEAYEAQYQISLVPLLESAGAVVLDKSYEDVAVAGQTIQLGGIYGYCVPEKFLETNDADSEECAFLDDFMNTDHFTLLMCHMPYTWRVLNGLEEWEIDCVMCGHAHGGQIRLPFVGGLYAPDEGWFPGVEQGGWVSEDGQRYMILSAGLGASFHIPRFHNVPEIVVLDLLPET